MKRDPDGKVAATTIRAPGPLTTGARISAGVIAPCIGLAEADIEVSRHEPVFASVGLEFMLVDVLRQI